MIAPALNHRAAPAPRRLPRANVVHRPSRLHAARQSTEPRQHFRLDEFFRHARAQRLPAISAPAAAADRRWFSRALPANAGEPEERLCGWRFRRGASSSATIGASVTTNAPGECSFQSVTTPRRRSDGKRACTLSRTGETPSGLLLPRPVMTSTFPARLTCRSRSHCSARKRASATVGSDSLRLRVLDALNSASSNAFQRLGAVVALSDGIGQHATVQFFGRCRRAAPRQRRRHVDDARKLRIAARLERRSVEDDRHPRIDIVRSSVHRYVVRTTSCMERVSRRALRHRRRRMRAASGAQCDR